jgi:hypothetical protein
VEALHTQVEDLRAEAVAEVHIPAVAVVAVVPTAVAAETAAAIIEAYSHSPGRVPRQCLGVWFLRVWSLGV